MKRIRFEEIKTHSFIAKEVKLLQYVRNRHLVDLEAASRMDFSIYGQDISERHARIPHLKELYERSPVWLLFKTEQISGKKKMTDIDADKDFWI